MDPNRIRVPRAGITASIAVAMLASFAPALGQQIPLDPNAIPKYVEPLPMPLRIDVTHTTALSPLELSMNEFQQKLLPNAFYAALPAPFDAGTYLWCYKAAGWPQTFPGPTLEAEVGTPTHVKYVNNLQQSNGDPPVLLQYLTIDQTLHWADPLLGHDDPDTRFEDYEGPIPVAPHLHGGEVPSAFDGGPDHWWTPGFGYKGVGFVTDQYVYPNAQQATTLWYHDHALGITRLNVIAGLAGFYLLRDFAAMEPENLPGGPDDTPVDAYGNVYEREIVFQDRIFDTNGQFIVPAVGDNPTLHPFWIPEFFGDAIMVNGKTWPYLDVEPRRYRFRFLNGSNARVYVMWLEDVPAKLPGPGFWQIGAEGGLLDTPALLNDPALLKPMRLTIAPGERADLIIDFSAFAGRTLTLKNSGRAPFPKGATPDPGTTGQLMQFRVGTTVTGGVDPSFDPATALSLRGTPIERPTPGTTVRALTLNEVMGPFGPLEALLNNDMWFNGVTENLRVGDTEVWEIINLTGDAHPIHPHLVQAQVLNRQRFNLSRYLRAYGMPMEGMGPPLPYDEPSALTGGKLGGNPDVAAYLQGPALPPDPNETGWKDTFRANPGEVLRLLVRVAPQDAAARALAAGTPVAPGYNYFDFEPWTPIGETDGMGYPGGSGYVWHCHILEHEDNEMMRPLRVLDPDLEPVPAAARTPVTEETTVKPADVLALAVPNPVHGTMFMRFSLPATGPIRLEVYDIAGKRVHTLASGTFPAGAHVVEWDGHGDVGAPAASGTYFVRLVAGGQSLVKRFAMVR